MTGLEGYLGHPVAELLAAAPFNRWVAERSIEEDLEEGLEPEVSYDFPAAGMAVSCDADERVAAIFLYFDDVRRFAGELADLDPTWRREQLLDHLGPPSKSGERFEDAILGWYGRWDRFDRPDHSLHVQFDPDTDRLVLITLMRPDRVP